MTIEAKDFPRLRTAEEITNSFHNSNDESGATLIASEKKCLAQEDTILKFMKLFRQPDYTGYEISLQFPTFKESSIRRSLSNLANPRKRWDALRKTGIKRAGSTPSKNFAYTVKNKYSQGDLFIKN